MADTVSLVSGNGSGRWGRRANGVVGVAVAAVLALSAAGCESNRVDDDRADVGGAPSVPHTGPTDHLAPSQRTAPTVPPPATPPPCSVDRLSVWTARVTVTEGGAGEIDAAIRIRNDGTAECEVDVSASSSADPTMEPDVWLEPGGWADLLLSASGCDPAAVEFGPVELDVNGEPVRVESVTGCDGRFVAFSPVEVSETPCDELRAAVVPAGAGSAVAVHHEGWSTCRLGELVSATGERVRLVARGSETGPDATDPELPLLAGGDVVAIPVDLEGECPAHPVELVFDSGVAIDVFVPGCAVTLAAGAPGPWPGAPF